MFELLIVAGAVWIVFALTEKKGAGFKWGGVALALCTASLWAPYPILRVFVAMVASLVLWKLIER